MLFAFRINKATQILSISESALHELTLNPTTFHNGSGSITVQGNNSTSSTMEEGGGAIFHEEKASPARRKRLKFKKKSYVSMNKKNPRVRYYLKLYCSSVNQKATLHVATVVH